ncbi:unnamed protein product, partial [Polarella glacialis]
MSPPPPTPGSDTAPGFGLSFGQSFADRCGAAGSRSPAVTAAPQSVASFWGELAGGSFAGGSFAG